MRIATLATALFVAAISASPAIADPPCSKITKEVLDFEQFIEERTSALAQAVAYYHDAQKYGPREANEWADKGFIEMRYRHLKDAHFDMAGWIGKAERNNCQPAQLFVKLSRENAQKATRNLRLAESAFQN